MSFCVCLLYQHTKRAWKYINAKFIYISRNFSAHSFDNNMRCIYVLYKITQYLSFFEYLLEWGKEIAFIVDIFGISIWYTGDLEDKEVMLPQDFSDTNLP